MSVILAAFTEAEERNVGRGLSGLVRSLRLLGGNVEEGYWAGIYRAAKGIPVGSWSNLPLRDFAEPGRGVEWKLLQRQSPFADQGKRIMHPAATRTIPYDPTQPAEVCKNVVLSQWAKSINDFETRTRNTSTDGSADIRWGILLWAKDLTEFLYFEERLIAPDPTNFRAEWNTGNHRGNPTRNLWIYDKVTNQKAYSVTLPANGAKLQPYFDIPTQKDGAYLFSVNVQEGFPLWVSRETFQVAEERCEAESLNHDELLRRLLSQ